MYLKEFLEQFKESNVRLFVDMDGVIADYDVGKAKDYDKKRPLLTSISKLDEISKMKNIELFILSVTRMNEGINQKNNWLDEYAPFFKKENRIIISREANNFVTSAELKENYICSLKRDDGIIIIIDDDPTILKDISKKNTDVILLKDTVLVD